MVLVMQSEKYGVKIDPTLALLGLIMLFSLICNFAPSMDFLKVFCVRSADL